MPTTSMLALLAVGVVALILISQRK
jgi:hypothetical protein